ncbi:low molecular weight protein tyrosine phosphatase family protein [soil metagenome]
MKHALFVCSQNKLRSPTAEQVFADFPGVATDSAGTNHDAINELAEEHILWADIIFVMEKTHREKVARKFGHLIKNQRVICLDIPDNYDFMDAALIALLKRKVTPLLA